MAALTDAFPASLPVLHATGKQRFPITATCGERTGISSPPRPTWCFTQTPALGPCVSIGACNSSTLPCTSTTPSATSHKNPVPGSGLLTRHSVSTPATASYCPVHRVGYGRIRSQPCISHESLSLLALCRQPDWNCRRPLADAGCGWHHGAQAVRNVLLPWVCSTLSAAVRAGNRLPARSRNLALSRYLGLRGHVALG